jgi:predicted dehydrogenase
MSGKKTNLSRRDVLGQGAALTGAAMAAGVFGSRAAADEGAAMDLSSAKEWKPVKALGEKATVRVGFVGVGGRGTGLLKDSMKEEGVTVKAICDLNAENLAKAVATVKNEQGHEPDTYTGDDHAYRKILERDDIDAVVLATPCFLHGLMYLDCARAGKHFFGEKPAAITLADADALCREVPRAGIVHGIGYQRRVSKMYHESVKVVLDGELGDLIQTYAAWDNVNSPRIGWHSSRAKSGDWMLEQACHTWDVLNWVVGKLPIAACGYGRRGVYEKQDPGRDVTDYFVATIEYPGMAARYSHSWGIPSDPRFNGVYERVIGTTAAMDMESGQILYYREKDKPIRKIPRDRMNHHEKAIRDFYNCVRKGEQFPSTVMNGRDATLVGLLVRQAVDERRVVTMADVLKGA